MMLDSRPAVDDANIPMNGVLRSIRSKYVGSSVASCGFMAVWQFGTVGVSVAYRAFIV